MAMRRILAYWPAAALLLAMVGFAAQRLVGPRLVGGPVRPPLMQVPPRPGDIPGGGADSAFGGAPPPRFTTLTRATGEGRANVTTYEVVAAQGWRSVLRTREELEVGGQVYTSEEWIGGAFDLYRLVFVHRGGGETGIQRIRVSHVRGRLFPLAVGNTLRIHTSAETQQFGRVYRSAGEYEFRVTGTTGAYAHATPAIPGPVYVIELRSPQAETPLIVHYAPELGAAVYRGGGDTYGERVVAWH